MLKKEVDLCLLDIDIPGKPAVEILEEELWELVSVPIIMTGKEQVNEKVLRCLVIGASDYCIKSEELFDNKDEYRIFLEGTAKNHRSLKRVLKSGNVLERLFNSNSYPIGIHDK